VRLIAFCWDWDPLQLRKGAILPERKKGGGLFGLRDDFSLLFVGLHTRGRRVTNLWEG